ncbi:MAG: LCP family protein [Ilumatobacteraceae bacterium]
MASPHRGYRRSLAHRLVLAMNAVIAAVLILTGIGILWAGQRLDSRQVVSINGPSPETPMPDAVIAPSDEWTLTEGDLQARNFLLTGSDNGSCVDPNSPYAGAFGDRTSFGERSDTIMVIRVSPTDNQAAFLSFPRDLWVKIAHSTRSNRINTAFDRKNPNRLIDTIYQNFGVPIDHYVNVDFCAFKQIVDAVGGVKVPFLYPTRDKKTGLYIPAPGCFSFSGDHALAYVRSRSGYRYLDPATGKWVQDGTGDLGRIGRQQDFIRRSMQRALDKGSKSPRVANQLLNAGLKNVITDDRLSAITMLQLAQAMRNLNTDMIGTYTVEASGQMIGDQSVLIPTIQNDRMRQILAIFQGKASLGTSSMTSTTIPADTASGEGALGNVQTVRSNLVISSTPHAVPTTTVPVVAPVQDTIGVVPPNDPSCH